MSGTIRNFRAGEVHPVRDNRLNNFLCNGCGVYERICNVSTMAVIAFELEHTSFISYRVVNSAYPRTDSYARLDDYSVTVHPYAACLHKSLDKMARTLAGFRGTPRELSAHEEARVLNLFRKAFEYELNRL